MTGIVQGQSQKRRRRGFERASKLVENRVRHAGESRGFAVSRLLTAWAEIVGPDIADIARPVEISYGRGFGATLTLLTTGAQAPMLEMQKLWIRDKVNACYGYGAIQRVRITQTSATGLPGDAKRKAKAEVETRDADPEVRDAALKAADGTCDENLRAALERLGVNVLSQKKQ